jgi:hypothetical protein
MALFTAQSISNYRMNSHNVWGSYRLKYTVYFILVFRWTSTTGFLIRQVFANLNLQHTYESKKDIYVYIIKHYSISKYILINLFSITILPFLINFQQVEFYSHFLKKDCRSTIL